MSDVEEHSDLEPTFPGDSDGEESDINTIDGSEDESDVEDIEHNEGENDGTELSADGAISLKLPTQLTMSGGDPLDSDISDDEISGSEDEDEDDEDEDEERSTFDKDDRAEFLTNYHPEVSVPSFEEVRSLCKVVYDKSGIIIDPLHTTQPVLTKYERARLIGLRATQLANGAQPLVSVPNTVINELIIAEEELKEKKLPFIIRRPMPNGGSEYWKLKDLMIL